MPNDRSSIQNEQGRKAVGFPLRGYMGSRNRMRSVPIAGISRFRGKYRSQTQARSLPLGLVCTVGGGQQVDVSHWFVPGILAVQM
jgi:hypothetical protein